MGIRSTKEEIKKLISGKTTGADQGFPFLGIEYDSRAIRGGELFIALKGDTTHGHSFVEKALESGAALAMVEDESFLAKSEHKDRIISVPDTLKAFWDIASWWRRKTDVPTVAITGSVGKTTTKEILASILMQVGAGNYALKSFNNHVGVPYTVCRTAPHHLWAVIEVGMNHPGEISGLSKIAQPDVAIVTEVQPAHIGAFDSEQDIAKEKLAICDGLKERGILVVNGDNSWIASELSTKMLLGGQSIVRVGESGEFRLSDISSNGLTSTKFSVVLADGLKEPFEVAISGRHNAMNASLALVAARKLLPAITTEQLRGGLARFVAPLMRMNLKELKDGRQILDDSYNANPASMRAMISVASDAKSSGLSIGLIVGDMKELGHRSKEFHLELGREIAAIKPGFVVAVGEFASEILEASLQSGIRAQSAPNPEEAAKIAVKESFDMLFVKGSRGVGLDVAVKWLLENF